MSENDPPVHQTDFPFPRDLAGPWLDVGFLGSDFILSSHPTDYCSLISSSDRALSLKHILQLLSPHTVEINAS